MVNQEKIALLIVAAGVSKRLGQPKQLVRKNNITLLENSMNTAIESKVGDIFLVLGANADLILKETQITDCQIIINENWQKGMGESIAFGLKKIVALKNYSGVIVSVADQPFLTSTILQKVKEKVSGEQIIIKSKYEEGSGPPVYFSRHFFEEMTSLTGDDGAKPLVKKYKEQVMSIDFLKGNIDIDKQEDLVHWS